MPLWHKDEKNISGHSRCVYAGGMKTYLIALLMLGLVACNREAPSPSISQTLPGAPEAPTSLTSIPAAFHGTWADKVEECAPGFPSRLTITSNELLFFESHGAITRVDVKSPTHIQAFGKFEGEGQSWDGQPEFRLVNGNELAMVVDGAPTERNRIKCP